MPGRVWTHALHGGADQKPQKPRHWPARSPEKGQDGDLIARAKIRAGHSSYSPTRTSTLFAMQRTGCVSAFENSLLLILYIMGRLPFRVAYL
eukprot:60432-Pelagomonas_calceolata.AAC.4